MGKYLLILSCSKTKKNIDRAPAIELYDGMYYKVLRKNFNSGLFFKQCTA